MLDTDHVGVLSHILGVMGEGFTVGGASASGNVGIIAGGRLVSCGAADVCVVVGALQRPSAMERQALVNVGALNSGGAGAPFDRSAAGFVPGEGTACVVLESAPSARARGARPRAELRGYAQRLDGNSLADPAEEGELATMRAAIDSARLAAADIDYVNAHGTGSPLGDATEASALRELFGTGAGTPWINATKGLTGHCLSAAGVLEAVATIVQLERGFVHPNFALRDRVDRGLRFVGERAQPARIRHALSNGFGFGGFNSAIVLAAP
jgi:malonyl-ACP decarboxylase